MRPETVEIKVTVSGGQVAPAITELGLDGGKSWSVLFFEDVTSAVTPGTPLLDAGVILRARQKSDAKGDSTVKLRPCRWTQLSDAFLTNWTKDDAELKIEADWAGPKHGLAASLTVDWADGRVREVNAGTRPASDLFTPVQQDFLARCGREPVNLAAISALPAFRATRWDAIAAGAGLSIRPERWTLPGGDDFLELSIVSAPDQAPAQATALDEFVAGHGLEPDRSQENKTQRVLASLIGPAVAPV